MNDISLVSILSFLLGALCASVPLVNWALYEKARAVEYEGFVRWLHDEAKRFVEGMDEGHDDDN